MNIRFIDEKVRAAPALVAIAFSLIATEARATTTTNSGVAYATACFAAGVPQPPDFASPLWNDNGTIPLGQAFENPGDTHEIFYFESNGTSAPPDGHGGTNPKGLCLMNAEISQMAPTLDSALVICQGSNGTACFYRYDSVSQPMPFTWEYADKNYFCNASPWKEADGTACINGSLGQNPRIAFRSASDFESGTRCAAYTSSSTCNSNNCNWDTFGNVCLPLPNSCQGYTTKSTCDATGTGCAWQTANCTAGPNGTCCQGTTCNSGANAGTGIGCSRAFFGGDEKAMVAGGLQCSGCHVGENMFINHPGTATDVIGLGKTHTDYLADDGDWFPSKWPDPQVGAGSVTAPAFNPGPSNYADNPNFTTPGTGQYDSVCLTCHCAPTISNKKITGLCVGGRFPQISGYLGYPSAGQYPLWFGGSPGSIGTYTNAPSFATLCNEVQSYYDTVFGQSLVTPTPGTGVPGSYSCAAGSSNQGVCTKYMGDCYDGAMPFNSGVPDGVFQAPGAPLSDPVQGPTPAGLPNGAGDAFTNQILWNDSLLGDPAGVGDARFLYPSGMLGCGTGVGVAPPLAGGYGDLSSTQWLGSQPIQTPSYYPNSAALYCNVYDTGAQMGVYCGCEGYNFTNNDYEFASCQAFGPATPCNTITSSSSCAKDTGCYWNGSVCIDAWTTTIKAIHPNSSIAFTADSNGNCTSLTVTNGSESAPISQVGY